MWESPVFIRLFISEGSHRMVRSARWNAETRGCSAESFCADCTKPVVGNLPPPHLQLLQGGNTSNDVSAPHRSWWSQLMRIMSSQGGQSSSERKAMDRSSSPHTWIRGCLVEHH